jgi:hypothetical protein
MSNSSLLNETQITYPAMGAIIHCYESVFLDIEPEFRKQLEELVPLVLHPRNLVVKKIGGQKVKAKELLHYFKAYTQIYQGNELPEPKSMLEATAEANNLSAVASAKDMYSSSMEEICGGNKPFMSTARIESEHDKVKEKAMTLFQSRRKMGGDDFSTKYRDTLEKVLWSVLNVVYFKMTTCSSGFGFICILYDRKSKICLYTSVLKTKARISSSLLELRPHYSALQLFSMFYPVYLDCWECTLLPICSIS